MKIDMAEELAEELGKVRDNLAAVLGSQHELETDLNRLTSKTLRGLLDVVSVLKTQERRLFDAFVEWEREDASGEELGNHIVNRLGYGEWYQGWLAKRSNS